MLEDSDRGLGQAQMEQKGSSGRLWRRGTWRSWSASHGQRSKWEVRTTGNHHQVIES